MGRKNWTFAGSDAGGRRAAAVYTLIQTARLNNIDPQTWLADIPRTLAGPPGIVMCVPRLGALQHTRMKFASESLVDALALASLLPCTHLVIAAIHSVRDSATRFSNNNP